MALIEVMAMHIPHELQDEFPQETSLIEQTIRTNYKFRRLAVRYDAVNRNIYSIESGEEPTTDEVLKRLKKRRLKLKDEIAAILTKLEHRMFETVSRTLKHLEDAAAIEVPKRRRILLRNRSALRRLNA